MDKPLTKPNLKHYQHEKERKAPRAPLPGCVGKERGGCWTRCGQGKQNKGAQLGIGPRVRQVDGPHSQVCVGVMLWRGGKRAWGGRRMRFYV